MKTLFFTIVLLCSSALGADFVAPKLTGPIVDEVGILGSQEKAELTKLLRSLHDKGKAQFTVLVTPSLQDRSIEEFGIKLAENWKLGSEKDDNGLILIVAPKERKMRFEVGRGLEGDIPDVVARRVLDDVMRPYFKDGNMETGIVAGVVEISRILGATPEEIKQTVAGSYPSEPTRSHKRPSPLKFAFVLILLVITFLAPVILGIMVGGVGYAFFSLPGGVVGFLIGFLIGIILRGGRSGRSGIFSGMGGGGGGFGGFSSGGGGGWSGGGGSFGGGGSSSSW